MRIVNPYPWGHTPRNEDVVGALARAVGGALLRADGARVASLSVQEIAGIGRAREGEAVFDEVYSRMLLVSIEGPAGRIATLRIAEDGGIHFQGADPHDMWTGFANAEDPRAVLAWLARAGAPQPLARWDLLHSDQGARAFAAWRAAIPPAISASVEGALAAAAIPGAFAHAAATQLEGALGGRPQAIAALLAWYGAGDGALAMRGDHELVARLVLARFGFDEVVATFDALAAERERAGAGRYVLDASPLPPVLATTIARVPEIVREGIVTALAAHASQGDASILRELLFPAPVGAPAGTALVGRSNTVKLRRPVTDGRALFAIDGTEVARFEGGQRTSIAMLLREAPLALHDGTLFWRTGAVIQRRTRDGAPLPNAQAPTAAETDAARAVAASWSVMCPEPGLIAIAPSAQDIEAFESFAHISVPPPPSARVAGRAFLDPEGPALVRLDASASTAGALLDASASTARVTLPGKPIFVSVTRAAIVLLVALADGVAIVTAPDSGEVRTSETIAASPSAVAFFLAFEGGALLGIDTGAGIVLARAGSEPAA